VKSEADSNSLGKALRTSFGNIGHSTASAFGKAGFHKVFVPGLRLACPTSRVIKKGEAINILHCVFANCFCFRLLGILFGLIWGPHERILLDFLFSVLSNHI